MMSELDPYGDAPPPVSEPPIHRPNFRNLLLDVDGIEALPAPESRIAGFLDKGTVHAIGGSWGSGKSFLALDWALCIATGKRWQDHGVEQGKVLYIAGEGAFGIRQRLNAWRKAWQTEIPRDAFLLLPRSPELKVLADVDQVAGMIHEYRFDVVVVDTLARAASGLDENSAQDMGRIVAALSTLLEATPGGKGTVIPVHHHGKGERASMRGSSAFEAGVDGIHVASKDGMLITIEHRKSKDRPLAGKTSLALSAVEGTGSAVLRAAPQGWSKRGQSRNAKELLTKIDQSFVVKTFTKAEVRKVTDLEGGPFTRAWSDLEESGEIIPLDSSSRPKFKRVSENGLTTLTNSDQTPPIF